MSEREREKVNVSKFIDDKEQQIIEILEGEDITFGMAKTIIQRAEAHLLEKGNTFLSRSMLKNVSSVNLNSHR